MQFNRLKLTGFKSFVDPTDLAIEPGLSGVVGPNGCGKSNLVEALRWVMGETSAKKMRGGGMDDVIFGGTADRPARNIAEVILVLDNAGRKAPAAFNDSDEIEISRRIERESGSTYRINGKDVRARDVQLLFADLATGARSAALVSQGRVGALINAKPADRRILLEEAAGISGLHSRRHEAELRLKAAETNLERLDDVLAALDGQLKGLKKQARQAARYRNIGEHIRKAEAILLHLRHEDADAACAAARQALDEVGARVTELTREAGQRTTAQSAAAEKLPDLRHHEAEAAAELHRLNVARDALDAEETRINHAKDAATARLQQIVQDIEREQALAADATTAQARLVGERDGLTGEEERHNAQIEDAAAAVGDAEREVDDLDAAHAALTETILGEEARRQALDRRIAELEERVQRLRQRAERVAAERAELEAASGTTEALATAENAVSAGLATLETRQQEAERAETERSDLQNREASRRETAQTAGARLAELRTEERALAAALADSGPDGWTPVIDAVSVAPGYEEALGAALGEDLAAADDEEAPVHWRALPPLVSPPPLPYGARRLSDHVTGPAALSRRLSQIGVVEDDATGHRLAAQLKVGQRLVSRGGGLWRWDGFTQHAGAETAAAARLSQRNRLTEIRGLLPQAGEEAAAAESAFHEARQAAAEAVAAERAARSAVQQAYQDVNAAKDAQARLVRETAENASRLAALDETRTALEGDLAEVDKTLGEAREAATTIGDLDGQRGEQVQLRERLNAARARLIERRSRHDRLLREAEARADRLAAIAVDLESWEERSANAKRQLDVLVERRGTTEEEIARLAAAPGEIAEKRQALLTEIAGSEDRRRQAADALAAAESELTALTKALRETESGLADAREQRARAEGAVGQAEQALAAVVDRMTERLDCAPGEALAIAGLGPDDALPALDDTEARLERLTRERDNMGPVNLRAEQEATELQEQIDSLGAEKGDLVEAIARLRQGINELNREGRERLLASFKLVNDHFEKLFVRLYGGGRAHLKLIEADDPLEAGLEIYASPPGKKLQVLSLLSGGEQALTALALLFAVFLTNPAPICVLDEVDAPLDDSNVDRFCSMLGEIARASATRFLVVTHHRMTMARMDRLYGVTMPERGVSQLVSVDLQTAAELRESA